MKYFFIGMALCLLLVLFNTGCAYRVGYNGYEMRGAVPTGRYGDYFFPQDVGILHREKTF